MAEITKHPQPAELEAYAARTLLPNELIGVDEHLARCYDCLGVVRALMNIARSCGDLRIELEAEPPEPPAHLGYKVIESYVDGLLTPEWREEVEAHAKVCPMCAEMVAALLKYKEICYPSAGE